MIRRIGIGVLSGFLAYLVWISLFTFLNLEDATRLNGYFFTMLIVSLFFFSQRKWVEGLGAILSLPISLLTVILIILPEYLFAGSIGILGTIFGLILLSFGEILLLTNAISLVRKKISENELVFFRWIGIGLMCVGIAFLLAV